MKKYLLKILLFFLVVLAIDLGVGFAGDYFQHHAKGGGTKDLDDLITRSDHDILVLGSSRAHHHYDAPYLSDTLGLDVYNAGIDGNGVVLAYGILSQVLKHSRPKLVIYDVEPTFDILVYENDNNHKRYISDLKPYYKEKEIGEIIKDVSEEEWYKVHSGMIRYNTDIIHLFVNNVIARSVSTTKGFEPMFGNISRDSEEKVENEEPIDEFKLKYVEHLIDLTQEHNIPIVVVASPKYDKCDDSVLQPVETICQNKGVPFLDYYSSPLFVSQAKWFKDPVHLNAEGAKAFSKEMVGQINGLIRTDE